MKRTALLGFMLGLVVAAGFAQVDIRNISSVGVDANFQGPAGIDVNQVVLFDVTDWLNGEVKLQRQDTAVLHETTISVAPIFIVSSYNYIIVRYGLGIGTGAEASNTVETNADGRSFSHDLAIDANHETASVYANLAVRGSYYPDDDYFFVLPTVAARFSLGSRWSVLGRYFFSYNSEQAISNAVLGEASYQLTDRFQIKAGASGALDLVRTPWMADDAPRDTEWEVTGITGFAFRVRPTLALRWHFEYLGRLGQADGIRNILVLDATF